ncbi:MAG: hypothetical protein H6581_25305 [Bacteroidia bacterium]|nr:hypothetical protein [Bacteroidia bacterium]
MKKTQILLVLLFSLIFINLLHSAPVILVYDQVPSGEQVCYEVGELQTEIRELIKFPKPLWNMDLVGNVRLSVTVDHENRIHVLKVLGENYYLVDHVERSLDGKLIRGNGNWVGKTYSTTIEFRKYS